MVDLIEPKEVEIPTQKKGEVLKVTISKFPCVKGREIVTQYPLTGAPKIGNYAANELLMYEMMQFVAVKNGNSLMRLSTPEIVSNQIPDWETLARIEKEMMEYNCSFFQSGKISLFFDNIDQNADKLITSILTVLSERLSKAGKQVSTNSKTSTH